MASKQSEAVRSGQGLLAQPDQGGQSTSNARGTATPHISRAVGVMDSAP